MKGVDIKNILIVNGYKLKDIAEKMGESPQNLSSMLLAQDIKTGVLERVAESIDKTAYWFYDMYNKDISLQTKTINEHIRAPAIKEPDDPSLRILFEIIKNLTAANVLLTETNGILAKQNDKWEQQIEDIQNTMRKMTEEMKMLKKEQQRGDAPMDSALANPA